MCHNCLQSGVDIGLIAAECFHQTSNLPVCWMGYELPASYSEAQDDSHSPPIDQETDQPFNLQLLA